MLISLFTNKLPLQNQRKIIEVAHGLDIEPNWLASVIYFETAKTFNPKIKNKIGSVGLIQFTRDKAGVDYKTINGVKYQLSDIQKMSFNEQMDLVYLYLKRFKGIMNSFTDVYFAVFFPFAMNNENTFVLQTKSLSSSLIANQNPIFDTNKDNKITKKEVTDFFKNYFQKNFSLINKKKL
jgi:hypothetical protein